MAGTILTTIGLSKLAAATPQNQLNITHIAVGDGNGGFPTLSPNSTALTNEVWRSTASNPIKDGANSNYVYFETNIPPEVGPFDVREIACFDTDGDMIAIGNTSLIQKPSPSDDASFAVAVKIFIALENASDFDLIYQNTEVTSHNSLADRDVASAHNASSVNDIGGTDVQDYLNENRNNKQAIEALYKSQGYNNVFFFADGFTYTESNDVGIYEDGTAWTYTDAGALPVTIAKGVVPSEGVYSRVVLLADKVKTSNGETAQEYINLNSYDLFFTNFNNAINTSSSNLSADFIEIAGGAKYTKSGLTGAPNTGDESEFFDLDGNGWKLKRQFGMQNYNDLGIDLDSETFSKRPPVKVVDINARFGKAIISRVSDYEVKTDLTRFKPELHYVDSSTYANSFYQQQIPLDGTWFTTGAADVFRTIITPWNGRIIDVGDAYNAHAYTENGLSYKPSSIYPSEVDSFRAIYGQVSADFGVVVEVKKDDAIMPIAGEIKLGIEASNVDIPTVIFVNPFNGSDFHEGTTKEFPVKTIAKALEKSPDVVLLKGGIYKDLNVFNVYSASKDLVVKSYEGRAWLTSNTTNYSSWALESGNVYKTIVSGSPTPIGAVDFTNVDELGMPTFPVKVNTLAECQSTEGTFYYDVTDRGFYINIGGSVPSDDETIVLQSAFMFRHSAPNQKVYIEGVGFMGGSGGAVSARNAGDNSALYLKDCYLADPYSKNGLDVLDVGVCITENCFGFESLNDGMNYTEFNAVSPHFIEMNNFNYRNKAVGTGNGSTSHDNCIGVRVGTVAFENNGPGIVDVGNSVTINAGIHSQGNSTNGIQADGNASVMVMSFSAYDNTGNDIRGTNGGSLDLSYGFFETYIST